MYCEEKLMQLSLALQTSGCRMKKILAGKNRLAPPEKRRAGLKPCYLAENQLIAYRR